MNESKTKYRVLVDRTITQSIYIEVESQSADPDDIKNLALDKAGDFDFSDAETSDPDYDAVDVEKVDAVCRERQRG